MRDAISERKHRKIFWHPLLLYSLRTSSINNVEISSRETTSELGYLAEKFGRKVGPSEAVAPAPRGAAPRWSSPDAILIGIRPRRGHTLSPPFRPGTQTGQPACYEFKTYSQGVQSLKRCTHCRGTFKELFFFGLVHCTFEILGFPPLVFCFSRTQRAKRGTQTT